MADPLSVAGLAVALPSLFMTCIQCFDLIESGRSHSQKFELLKTKLEIQRCQLFSWGQGQGLVGHPEALDCGKRLDEEPVKSLVRRVLCNIYRIFQDTDRLTKRYGLKKPDKRLPMSAMRDDVPKASYEEFVRLVQQTQSTTGVGKLMRWAIHDEAKFTRMIDDIKELVEGLKMLADPDVPPLLQDAEINTRPDSHCVSGGTSPLYTVQTETSVSSGREREVLPAVAKTEEVDPAAKADQSMFASMEEMVEFMQKDCLSSLENPQRNSRQCQIENTYESTYDWLFSNRASFQHWLRSPQHDRNAIFWIQGKPGSGKSTLMKYAIQHEKCASLLNESTSGEWSISSFFFNDRGSDSQKTVDGLHEEMLYQILSTAPQLVKYVYRFRQHAVAEKATKDLGLKSVPWLSRSKEIGISDGSTLTWTSNMMKAHASLRIPWSPSDVDLALDAICKQDDYRLQLCFFIDALDEHTGDHKKLVKTLSRFIRPESSKLCIKLCLASRQEPIFWRSFGNCPGIVLHEYTKDDIGIYVYGQLKESLEAEGQTDYFLKLQQISQRITDAAEGVFIWVKLVVDELLDGILDGNNILQLQRNLDSIPTELDALYQRAMLRRKDEHIYESYIMFQTVRWSLDSITLSNLAFITDVTLGLEHTHASKDSMKRRLQSRCMGMLEIRKPAGGIAKHDNHTEAVQFLHQTVKTYVQKPLNESRILSETYDVRETDGITYIIKACIHLLHQQPLRDILDHQQVVQNLSSYHGKREGLLGSLSSSILNGMVQRNSKISYDELIHEAAGSLGTPLAQNLPSNAYVIDIYNYVLGLPVHLPNLSTKVMDSSAQITSLPSQRALSRNPSFVGYENILARLDSAFSHPRRPPWVILSGLGGIGKTQIAIEYSHRFAERQPRMPIFYVDAHSQASFELAYVRMAIAMGLTKDQDSRPDILQLVKEWLSNEEHGSWLLILDNVDGSDMFLKPPTMIIDSVPNGRQGAVIITTRDSRFASGLEGRHVMTIDVQSMDLHDAIKLFQSRIPDAPDNEVTELVTVMEKIPLAINQACKDISLTRSSVSSYLEKIRHMKND